MRYRIYTSSSGRRSLRKLPPAVRKDLLEHIQNLAVNPTLGEPLKGTFRFLRSLHVVYQGTHYRIIYEVAEKAKEIHIHLAGSRESFYKQLVRLRLKPSARKRVS